MKTLVDLFYFVIFGLVFIYFYYSLERVFDFHTSFDVEIQYLVRGGVFCQWIYFLPFSCKFGQIVLEKLQSAHINWNLLCLYIILS